MLNRAHCLPLQYLCTELSEDCTVNETNYVIQEIYYFEIQSSINISLIIYIAINFSSVLQEFILHINMYTRMSDLLCLLAH